MTINPHPAIPSGLPALDPASRQHQRAVEACLIRNIEEATLGFLPFEQWMNLALYAPGLGYYAAGNTKFSGDLPTGDFTTAPELTPLFGQTLARQTAQILAASDSNRVLEFGAGSGALAAALIPALRQLGIDVDYQILEISADLRARQQQNLAGSGAPITWLDHLPETFSGCVIANEVLDAMPATLFRWGQNEKLYEIGVSLSAIDGDISTMTLAQRATRLAHAGHAGGTEQPQSGPLPNADAQAINRSPTDASPPAVPFIYVERLASQALQQTVAQRMPALAGYQSEINLQAEAWIRQMGSWLERGAALLIDYGFPQREYYHPQRATGTLMCHFRHHAHSEPLLHAGLQDITTHVDFTAMADAALAAGLDVLGYTSQARFLMNAGLPQLLAQLDPSDAQQYARAMAPVQKLIAETEMGELFKVLAIGRGVTGPLTGFASGDRRHRL
jgi:SAM-dependent MidA family methyltransferase